MSNTKIEFDHFGRISIHADPQDFSDAELLQFSTSYPGGVSFVGKSEVYEVPPEPESKDIS